MLDKYRTLAGVTLPDMLKEMKRVLHKDAYKEIRHQSYLTDIDSTFLTQTANKLFGPVGIGWRFNFNPADMVHFTYEREVGKDRDKRIQTVHAVGITHFELSYAYLDEKDEQHWSEPIVSTGGSENEYYGYALKGAITSCLGAAFSHLEWQLYVYRGKVDHTNAEEMKPVIDAQLDGKVEEKKTTPSNGKQAEKVAESKKEEPKKAEPAEAKKEATKPAEAKKEESKPKEAATKKKPASTKPTNDPLQLAAQFPIPESKQVPLTGVLLGDAIQDVVYGETLLNFLVGVGTNKKGEKFNPQTEEEKQLEAHAKVLFNARTVA